jgi:WD40 repeat protein
LTTTAIVKSGPLTGHTGWVHGVVQINANQVASGAADNAIKIWNIATNTLAATLTGHPSVVVCLGVMSGSAGGQLVTGDNGGSTIVWNTLANSIQTMANQTSGIQVSAMVWNPVIGKMVMLLSQNIGLLDPTTLSMTVVTTNNNYYDGDVLLTNGNVITCNEEIRVYSMPSGSLLNAYTPYNVVWRVKILPDNVTLVCGYQGPGGTQLFNLNTHVWSANYTGHTDAAMLIALTPDQLFVITAGCDNQIIIWAWSTMSLTKVNTFTATGASINAATLVSTSYTGICKRQYI